MNKHTILPFLVILSLPFMLLAADNDISSMFPDDPLVYLQSANMTALIDSYQASDFGKKYLETAAFRDFGDSKLYLKLEEKIGNWERLTGFRFHINNIREFAGSESAVAVYNIGDIQLLFATKVTYSQAAKSKLFKLKANFETKKKDDVEYYIKQSSEGTETFAFGYVKNVLLVATDISLFERTLSLMKGKTSSSLANLEPFEKSALTMNGDLLMFADMGKLVSDTYFRSYWIYRNITALKWMQYAVSSVRFESCGALEERVYIPFTGSALKMTALNKDGLARMLPQDSDYYLLTTAVDTGETINAILSEAWGLPAIDAEGEVRNEKQKKLLNLKIKLGEYITKLRPKERLDLVLSDVGDDPFAVEISSPVMLLVEKITEDDIKNMLALVSVWFASETSFKESFQYPVKSVPAGEWKFFYLETPIYLSETFSIGYKSNAIVFLRSIKNISRFTKTGAPQGLDKKTVSQMNLSLSKTGVKFFKVFDGLKNAPGWTGSERKDLFSENLRSLFKLLDKIKDITTTDRIEGNKLLRSIVYSCR